MPDGDWRVEGTPNTNSNKMSLTNMRCMMQSEPQCHYIMSVLLGMWCRTVEISMCYTGGLSGVNSLNSFVVLYIQQILYFHNRTLLKFDEMGVTQAVAVASAVVLNVSLKRSLLLYEGVISTGFVTGLASAISNYGLYFITKRRLLTG